MIYRLLGVMQFRNQLWLIIETNLWSAYMETKHKDVLLAKISANVFRPLCVWIAILGLCALQMSDARCYDTFANDSGGAS